MYEDIYFLFHTLMYLCTYTKNITTYTYAHASLMLLSAWNLCQDPHTSNSSRPWGRRLNTQGIGDRRIFTFYSIHLYVFFFLFWPSSTACGILVPQPGMGPRPLAVKAPSPNHWMAKEFPFMCLLNFRTMRIYLLPMHLCTYSSYI